MKNRIQETKTKLLMLLILCVTFYTHVSSQADVAFAPGHIGTNPLWYCGWNAATTFPLNITHFGPQNINFRTTYAFAPPLAGNRMIITDGLFGVAAGRIAMGNSLLNSFVPTARLHLHQTAGTPNLRFTTTATGSLATNGFEIGMFNTGFAYLSTYQNNQPITFNTENTTGTPLPFERLRISADNFNGFTSIGNTLNFSPNAQLHINNIGLTNGGLGAAAYGNLFQTDGTGTNNNAWSMFTDFGGLTQKFNLTAPASTNNLQINTEQSDGIIQFRTFGVERMRINSSLGLTAGFVGIGTIVPNQRLTVDAGNINIQTTTNGLMINNIMSLWRGSTGDVSNIFIGAGAGTSNGVLGLGNVFCGWNSGFSNTDGTSNDFSGAFSGFNNTTGSCNTFYGLNSGFSNTSGSSNAFFGWASGLNNTANSNTFIGNGCGFNNTIGDNNTFTGANTGLFSTTGMNNTFTGATSGVFNDGGSFNTFTGAQSGFNNTNGFGSTFNGFSSGFNNIGNSNTFIGFQSGLINTTGSNNTFLGSNSNASANNFNNSAAIGTNTIVNGSDRMILGNNINVGIGLSNDNVQFGPQNLLEINAGTGPSGGFGQSVPGSAGVSGLRFRDLHSASATTLNPGLGVLAVDGDGNVIYVPGAAGIVTANNGLQINPLNNVQLGQQFPGGGFAQLIFDTEVPLNNFNLLFTKPLTNQEFNQNNIGIGTSNPLARLDVFKDLSLINAANGTPIALRVENTDVTFGTINVGEAYGIYSIMNADNKGNYGGYFLATSPNVNNAGNIGVQGVGENGVSNYGVYGVANGTTGTSTNRGGFFIANTTGEYNYGGQFEADFGSTLSHAVSASSPINTGINFALYVNGDATQVAGSNNFSDSIIKTNVQPITNATATLVQLKPKTFDFKYNDFPSINFDYDNHMGVIAQDVESVLPNLVSTVTVPAVLDSNNNIVNPAVTIKTVNYTEFTPLLIAGFKEHEARIDSLAAASTDSSKANNGLTKTVGDTIQFGQAIGGTGAALTNNREIPMNNNNIYFTGQSTIGANSFAIGSNGGSLLTAKFTVTENGTGSFPIAIQGRTSGGTDCIGGDFHATNGSSNAIGIQTSSSGGTNSYGVLASASGGTANTYGVFTTAPAVANCNALFVNGNTTLVSGVATRFGSDSTIKTNIQPLTNATAILEQLNPKTFDFRYNDYPSLMLDQDNHMGVIAQDVENVLPNLISTVTIPEVLDSNNNVVHAAVTIKTVKYQEFIPLLIAGFNEQQNKIDTQDSTIAAQNSTIADLQNQINDVIAMVTNCCSQGSQSLQDPNNNGNNTYGNNYVPVHTTDVRLTDNYCVLGENSPNPFRDHTVINYNIAETIREAQIVFYNNLGQVIKVLEINDRGEGRLNVYGEDLRSGMYTYSLIVDGNVCESKKMIKE